MTQPIIPWPGGKRRLLKHLYPHFPAHECYVEAFAGFTMVPLQIRYTIGREGRDKPAGELIIKSWDDNQAQLL